MATIRLINRTQEPEVIHDVDASKLPYWILDALTVPGRIALEIHTVMGAVRYELAPPDSAELDESAVSYEPSATEDAQRP